MPRIPQYTAKRKLPEVGPGVRGGSAGAEYGELARFGETMTDIGAKFTEKLRQAREVAEYSNAKTAAKKEFNELELELAQDPDYKSFPEKFKKRKDEIWKRL